MNDRAKELAEELLAVEILEYHNKNWLSQDDAIRSKRKQWLLKELIDILETVLRRKNQIPTINKEVFLKS